MLCLPAAKEGIDPSQGASRVCAGRHGRLRADVIRPRADQTHALGSSQLDATEERFLIGHGAVEALPWGMVPALK